MSNIGESLHFLPPAPHAKLLEFAEVLKDAGFLNDRDDVMYFFEKPHKWQPEYEIWREQDEPTMHDENWEWFVRLVEQRNR